MSIIVDRSMSKAEYRHWRKQARYHGRYDSPHWSDWQFIPDSRAEWTAACEKTARRLAMEIRLYRLKSRMGMRP